jgi:DNA-binding CsgD family transcriptional regulator
LARLEAVRGHTDLCDDRVARSRREAGPYGVDLRLVLEPAVRGLAALGAGEPSAAVEPLEAAWAHARGCGLENPNVVPFAGDLAEAHARCGNRARATEVVAWLEERASALRLSGPLAGVWRCRGLLADDASEAASAFAAAKRVCDSRTTPFELARTLLCEGEVLRRHRHPAAARSPLRRAVHLFEGLGAIPWAQRAAAELSATGGRDAARPVAAGPATLELLTPQQLQIARLVAAGRNNVETAEALYLSRKTVEAHLTQVYRRLGVHSRTQLAKALLASG